uniref:Uncharacterized protein n=1 Tax=Knipowitschia caucasica TaxID=637954 RepID=A0AAV2JD84_KNICA
MSYALSSVVRVTLRAAAAALHPLLGLALVRGSPRLFFPLRVRTLPVGPLLFLPITLPCPLRWSAAGAFGLELLMRSGIRLRVVSLRLLSPLSCIRGSFVPALSSASFRPLLWRLLREQPSSLHPLRFQPACSFPSFAVNHLRWLSVFVVSLPSSLDARSPLPLHPLSRSSLSLVVLVSLLPLRFSPLLVHPLLVHPASRHPRHSVCLSSLGRPA